MRMTEKTRIKMAGFCSGVWIVPVLLLVVVGSCHCQDGDTCSQYLECDLCIAASARCVWCPEPPPFPSVRCTSRENANCSLPVEDPVTQPPRILRNVPLDDNEQIAPQEYELELRAGDSQTFTLSVKPSKDYPLDVYFLMDLSGSLDQDLATIQNISGSITDELASISSQFALGFGSFVDKVAYPFASTLQNGLDNRENHLTLGNVCANGRSGCDPTYTYRHQLSMTNDSQQFSDVVNGLNISSNIDSSENPLDALVQAVNCSDIIGWRSNSLKLVMMIVDSGFKTALDGKLAAVIRRNDGQCHLQRNEEQGYYEYLEDSELDFPSIYQVRQLLIENDIITIFASTEPSINLYQDLIKELGTSRTFLQEIQEDSSNIISVIRNAHASIIRDVVVDDIPGLSISVTPGPNCNLTSDGRGCANVTIEQLVTFNITVTMEECLEGSTDATLSLPGFGSVLLRLIPFCECNCSSYKTSNDETCNEEGSLVCGTCECNSGISGEQCECNRPLTSCPNNCFDRGICDQCSRECTCIVEENGLGVLLGSFGENCKCDNTTVGGCPSGADNLTCSGRGSCGCNPADCDCDCTCSPAPISGRRYFEPDCSCNPDNCYNEAYPNNVCVYTRGREEQGTCTCDGCVCSKFMDSVSFNRTCLHNDDLCSMFESCARCGVNCTRDDCSPGPLDDSPGGVLCSFRENGCTVDFEVALSGPHNTIGMVFVGEERACQDSDLGNIPWIIAVSIVGGILLLGVLVLIIAKILLLVIDRKEYKKFLSEMDTGDFTPHNNPLYVTPETEYKNPIAKANLKRQKLPDIDPDSDF